MRLTARRREQDPDRPDGILLLLDDPVTGLLPWFAVAFLVGPMTFLGASLVALGLSALLVLASKLRGEEAKILELSDLVFFAALSVVAAVSGPSVTSWLNDHADEVANVAVALLAYGSLVVGRPFTTQYTISRFPNAAPELLERLDRVGTWIWALALTFAALAGGYGEFVLPDLATDLWTGWILQTAPLIVAFNLTIWIDRRALARQAGEPPFPGIWALLRDISFWFIPSGILSLAFHSAPGWVGWMLVGIGIALTLTFWALQVRGDGRLRIVEPN
ncbi:MAG: hypothetical protein F2813_02435 [Actinobacteria bacterium]|uniref:Unannotated protein n=1 Tax=freshwater metagenome TaxID=449393 RepID=A0A6J5ZBR4_9ZZZZ|nr:hypothetical protein [Actinomycetota bacterium]